MPYFLSPKVIYGKGALKRLSAEMEGKGLGKRTLPPGARPASEEEIAAVNKRLAARGIPTSGRLSGSPPERRRCSTRSARPAASHGSAL